MIINMTEDLLKDWQLNDRASETALREAAATLDHELPVDYLEFMRRHDGGEGFIKGNYVILWKAEELASFNAEYEVAQYAPGLILFGSTGGGEGYGFDTRDHSMAVVQVPFIGMAWEYARPVATSFTACLERLARS